MYNKTPSDLRNKRRSRIRTKSREKVWKLIRRYFSRDQEWLEAVHKWNFPKMMIWTPRQEKANLTRQNERQDSLMLRNIVMKIENQTKSVPKDFKPLLLKLKRDKLKKGFTWLFSTENVRKLAFCFSNLAFILDLEHSLWPGGLLRFHIRNLRPNWQRDWYASLALSHKTLKNAPTCFSNLSKWPSLIRGTPFDWGAKELF